jgi:thiol:disulfide interchange protein
VLRPFLFLLALVAFFGVGYVISMVPQRSGEAALNTQGSRWQEGVPAYEQALARHHAENVPMLVLVESKWCGYCKHLNKKLNEEPLSTAFASFAKVKIDPENSKEEEALKKKLGAKGFPTFLVIPAGSDTPRRVRFFRYEKKSWQPVKESLFIEEVMAVAFPKEKKKS